MFANCRSQFLLDRLGRCRPLTVRIVWQYILSRVRISVRPSIFYMRKTLKTSGKPGRQCQCLFQWPATSYYHQRSGPSRLAGTDPSNSDTATAVCVCMRTRRCVCRHVRASVRLCVRNVIAIYDNNIWPRLIMIIIKNIILYFIQIRHTDDFPSTGTRLVKVLNGSAQGFWPTIFWNYVHEVKYCAFINIT